MTCILYLMEAKENYKKYTTLLIIVLSLSKVLNLGLNIVIVRFVHKQDFGYVSIRL